MAVGGQSHASAGLLPGNKPGTHYTVGCVDPRVGLAGCGQSLRFAGLSGT